MPGAELLRLDLSEISTELPGPRARAVIERDRAVLSPSYTRCYPLVVARGQGAIVEDVDGNRFLDFNAGIAVCSTGHCHPRVVEAIRAAGGRADPHVGYRFLLRDHGDAGRAAGRRAPLAASAAGFTSAIRAQRRWKRHEARALSHGPRKVHRFLRRLPWPDHGVAFAHREQGSPAQAGSGRWCPGVHHAPYPNPTAFAGSRGPYADASFAAIEEICFRTTVPADEVAAFVVEPVQGEGGYLVPPKRFFAGTRDLRRPPRYSDRRR